MIADVIRRWGLAVVLGASFLALAWARRRSGVGRTVDIGDAARLTDAWAEIARQRRRELVGRFALWSIVLIALWGLFVAAVDALMPHSQSLGWVAYLLGGGYLLWSAFAYAVRMGYRYGVVDAAALWQERTRERSNA